MLSESASDGLTNAAEDKDGLIIVLKKKLQSYKQKYSKLKAYF